MLRRNMGCLHMPCYNGSDPDAHRTSSVDSKPAISFDDDPPPPPPRHAQRFLLRFVTLSSSHSCETIMTRLKRAFLLYGKHVLVRKPLPPVFAEAEEMVELAAQMGRIF